MSSKPCGICAEPTAGKHYGGICCRGCKGFFRRSVRLQRKYVCAYASKCEIEKEYRNCCRACRFAKCLSIGLDPRLVHSDRACDLDAPWRSRTKSEDFGSIPDPFPDSSTRMITDGPSTSCGSSPPAIKVKDEPVDVDEDPWSATDSEPLEEEDLDAHFGKLLIATSRNMYLRYEGTLGSRRLIPQFDRLDLRSVHKYFRRVDYLVDEFYDHDHNHILAPKGLHSYSIDIPIESAFFVEPRRISDRSKMLWKPMFWLKDEGFGAMWTRITLHYIDWASHIPELSELSPDDQLKMMVGRCVPSVWMIISHRSMRNASDKKCVLMSGGSYVPLDADELGMYGKTNACQLLIEAGHWMWNEFIEPARELKITDAEFALLRVICYLSPVPQLSAEGRRKVRDAQAFYRSVLTDVIVRQQSNKDFNAVSSRLSALLTLLPPIERTSQIEDDHMTILTMFNVANMAGKLTYEFYVRRTMRC